VGACGGSEREKEASAGVDGRVFHGEPTLWKGLGGPWGSYWRSNKWLVAGEWYPVATGSDHSMGSCLPRSGHTAQAHTRLTRYNHHNPVEVDTNTRCIPSFKGWGTLQGPSCPAWSLLGPDSCTWPLLVLLNTPLGLSGPRGSARAGDLRLHDATRTARRWRRSGSTVSSVLLLVNCKSGHGREIDPTKHQPHAL
jgi:hypothetical protein